jgi:hypothetical protein
MIPSHDISVNGVEITTRKAATIVKTMIDYDKHDKHKIYFVQKSWEATTDPGQAIGDETEMLSGLCNIWAFV